MNDKSDKNDKIVLGTMNFGKSDWGINKKESFSILDTYYDEGYRTLDTSNFYAKGNSEKIIGEWIESTKCTDVKTCTKVGGQDPSNPNIKGLSSQSILHSIKNSLKRLKLEKVFLFYLHYPDVKHDLRDTLLGVKKILDTNLSTNWGISNYTTLELKNLLITCDRLGVSYPLFFQTLINPVEFNVMYELVPFAKQNNIRVLSWSPILGGLLTNSGLQNNLSKRFLYNTFWVKYLENPILKDIYKKYTKTNNVTTLQNLVLNWLIKKMDVDCIIGFDNTDQMNEIFTELESSASFNNEDFFDDIISKFKIYPYDLLDFMGAESYIRKKKTGHNTG